MEAKRICFCCKETSKIPNIIFKVVTKLLGRVRCPGIATSYSSVSRYVGGFLSLLYLNKEADSVSEAWILTWVDRPSSKRSFTTLAIRKVVSVYIYVVFSCSENAGTWIKLNRYKYLNYQKENNFKETLS
jgi:hypothetical protein